jgi:hypothetical protein
MGQTGSEWVAMESNAGCAAVRQRERELDSLGRLTVVRPQSVCGFSLRRHSTACRPSLLTSTESTVFDCESSVLGPRSITRGRVEQRHAACTSTGIQIKQQV